MRFCISKRIAKNIMMKLYRLFLIFKIMRQKIDLPLDEQPDLLDIAQSYQHSGGEFWIALSDGRVIGYNWFNVERT